MSNVRLCVSVAALGLACAIPASAQSTAKPQGSQPAAPAATTGTPPRAACRRAGAVHLRAGRAAAIRSSACSRAAAIPRVASDEGGRACPGVLIAEVTVKGIVRDRSGFIAMIQGTGTKTFIVRAGEKLMDGTVKAITADSVVFSQDVNDPLSMVKQKEVRKTVRSADGGRE